MEEYYVQGDIDDLLTIIAWLPVVLYGLIATMWPLYLAGMNMKRNRDKLTWETKLVAYPVFAFGLLWDVVFNMIYGTVVYLEIPREGLFTKRCQRHLKSTDWRQKVAHWHCHVWLNPFDPDEEGHC